MHALPNRFVAKNYDADIKPVLIVFCHTQSLVVQLYAHP